MGAADGEAAPDQLLRESVAQVRASQPSAAVVRAHAAPAATPVRRRGQGQRRGQLGLRRTPRSFTPSTVHGPSSSLAEEADRAHRRSSSAAS